MSWIDRILGRKPLAEPAPVTIHLDMRALAGGRLSRDSESTLLGAYGTVLDVPESPESDWRRLNLDANTLDRLPPSALSVILADLSPDVSMALWNWLRMCNPGWTCTVTRPGTSDPDLPAQALLDTFLAGLRGPYVNQTPGANVVIGMALSSLFLRGAALMELVLDARGRVPVNIAVPDPIYARYKKVKDPVYGDGYELGQYQDQRWVPFDRPTIISVPLDPLPTGPYGRPVAGSSLNTVLFLVAVFNDLRRVIQQQGWPRMDLEVDLPALLAAMPPESDDPQKLQNWAQEAIDQIVKVYNALEPDEAYVHLNTTKVNGVAGAAGSAGLAAIGAIVQSLERRMARALKTQPMFLGITDSSTESQARQQVAMQAAGIRAVQHALEDALTRLLTLALQVQGVLADVSFRFSELRALEADANAVTDAKEIANWEAKVRNGWATADEAAMAVMGHPAVGEAVAGQVEMFTAESAMESTESTEDLEDDGEPMESADDETMRRRLVRAFEWLGSRPANLSARVTVKPDGADEGPLPLPDTVEFTDAEIEDASDVWDELMPDYAGLLDADYLPEEDEERAAGVLRIGATPRRIGNVIVYGTRRPLAEGENPWEYEAASRRYRDKRTGRWLSHTRMIEMRDDYVTAYQSRVTGLAERVMSGDMTLQQWERGMRRELKSLHIGQYELGRGGRKAMTQADWGRLGAEMRRQYEHLRGFAADIAAGNLSPAQVAARSQLYLEASTASYERGRAAAHRLVLPAYPGDGSTQCRVNCKCTWRITEDETAWNCYWTLGQAEHCEDCVTRSQTWAPYIYPKV